MLFQQRKPPWLCILLLLTATATVSANLSYLSPSTKHPEYALTPPTSPLSKRAIVTSHLLFPHGIASGDPYSDSVILWTRAVPEGVNSDTHIYPKNKGSAACVAWEISATEEFTEIADAGTTATDGDVDYTVKVEARGLRAKTYYWYRFKSCDGVAESTSEVGRTKTMPAEDDELHEGVRFAVYSCANYAEGYFNVYGMSARKDSVDYVLHLGDYIYEMPLPTSLKSRIPRPVKETITLRDYRLRFATHRTDSDLLLLHATLPIIPLWDDHEIANNGWREGLASPQWMWLEWSSWDARVEAAIRAYFEWMPIRQVAADDTLRIWRNFRVGKLADLVLLDTRYYDRDRTVAPELAGDEERSMMGANQETWLRQQLEESAVRNATWTVLAQQVQFSNINETAVGAEWDTPFYYDGWAGYQSNRRRVLEGIVESGVSNPVVLTGDYHTLWTADLVWADGRKEGYQWESGEGALGIELAVTSVTSSNGYGDLSYSASTDVSEQLVADNDFLKWAEGYYRGYFELTLTPEKLTARYFAVPDVATHNSEEREIAVWESLAGEKRLKRPLPKVTEGALQSKLSEWAGSDKVNWARRKP